VCVCRANPFSNNVELAYICENIDFNYVRYKPGQCGKCMRVHPKSVPTRVHFYTQFSISITLHYMFVSGRLAGGAGVRFRRGPSSGPITFLFTLCKSTRAADS
jgi:hypothetical protein